MISVPASKDTSELSPASIYIRVRRSRVPREGGLSRTFDLNAETLPQGATVLMATGASDIHVHQSLSIKT